MRQNITSPGGSAKKHGFYYNKQIILLYLISSTQSEWLKIYKDTHSSNRDIETWCQSHQDSRYSEGFVMIYSRERYTYK